MKKSLIIIASALILAVGAAGTSRLRYASSVFGGGDQLSSSVSTQTEYPPCVRGVREDRCIQLYERGVRRSYREWLARNGRSGELAERTTPSRRAGYRTCRGPNDDRCIQQRRTAQAGPRMARPAVRWINGRPVRARNTAIAARPARAVARPAVRTARTVTPVRAVPASSPRIRTATSNAARPSPTRAAVREVAAPRPSSARQPAAPTTRRPSSPGHSTPGI